MIIGTFAACMVMIGDMLLGWGLHDNTKTGMEGFLSAYLTLPDSRIFWSSFLGMIGIPLEALCYFSVYRLIAPNSRHYAHLYRNHDHPTHHGIAGHSPNPKKIMLQFDHCHENRVWIISFVGSSICSMAYSSLSCYSQDS